VVMIILLVHLRNWNLFKTSYYCLICV